jgi:DNA primase
MRVSDGSFQRGTSELGEYHLHRLDAQPTRSTGAMPSSVATPALRDAVYSAILDALHLSPAHVDNLLSRGLDEEAIARNGYATMPRMSIMAPIIEAVACTHDVASVPGVTVQRGHWTLAAGRDDLLIPVRDARWKIVALIRRTGDAARKYLWCSTPDTPSGAPAHHAEPWNVELRRAIYITEGPLKADLIANFLGITTIGLPGCSPPAAFATQLREDYPHAQSVFVALDCDAATNRHVGRARDHLESTLISAGYHTHRVEWDASEGKGLDDVLAAAQRTARPI